MHASSSCRLVCSLSRVLKILVPGVRAAFNPSYDAVLPVYHILVMIRKDAFDQIASDGLSLAVLTEIASTVRVQRPSSSHRLDPPLRQLQGHRARSSMTSPRPGKDPPDGHVSLQ